MIAPRELEDLDQYQSECIDVVAGGTYTPSTPVMIGGAGISLQTPAATISGKVTTGPDSRGLILKAHEHPALATTQTRTIVVPLVPSADYSADSLGTIEVVYDPYGIKSRRTSQGGWAIRIPLGRLHHGGTLLRARLRWRPSRAPTTLSSSTEIPWLRLVRAKKTGALPSDYTPNMVEHWKVPARVNLAIYAVGDIVHSTGGAEWEGSNLLTYRCVQAGQAAAVQPAMSTTIGANQNDGGVVWRVEPGWANPIIQFLFPPIPLGASPSDYYNNGLVQEIVHPINMNATIDTETYFYVAELFDPGRYGNIYHSLAIDIGGLTHLKEA